MNSPFGIERCNLRTFVICLLGLFFAVFCKTSTSSILTGLEHDFGITHSDVLWVDIIPSSCVLALCFVAVVFANRFGKVTMLRAGFLFIALAFLPLMLHSEFIALVISRYMASIGLVLILVTTYSILADIVREDRLVEVFALCSVMTSLGVAVGPITGVFLNDLFDTYAVFLLPVPFCYLALWGLRGAKNVVVNPQQKLHLPMHLLLILGISVFIFGLTVPSTYSIRWIAIGLTLMAAFTYVRYHSDDRILTGDIMHNKAFVFSFFIGVVYNMASYCMINSGNMVAQLHLSGTVVILEITLSMAALGALSMSLKTFTQAALASVAASFMRKHKGDYVLIGMLLLLIPAAILLVALNTGFFESNPELLLVTAVLLGVSYVFFTPVNKKTIMVSVAEKDRNFASSMNSISSESTMICCSVIISNMTAAGCFAQGVSTPYACFILVLMVAVAAVIVFYIVHRAHIRGAGV